jgi:hypothetical protein
VDGGNIPQPDIAGPGVVRSTWAIEYVRYPQCYGHFQRAEISKTASLLSFGDSCFSKSLKIELNSSRLPQNRRRPRCTGP